MSQRNLEELAEARRKAQWFLATMPDHSMAGTLRTFLVMTAPVTKEEAIPVMVANLNTVGEWPSYDDDVERARDALNSQYTGSWGNAIRAQWATLVHFNGGAE